MQLFNSLVCWTKHPVKKTKDLWCKCMLLTILYICCELFRALIRDQFEHYLEETKTVKSKIKFLNKCSLCLLSTKKLFSFCTLLVVDWFCVIFVYYFDLLTTAIATAIRVVHFYFPYKSPRPGRGHRCTDIWNNKRGYIVWTFNEGKISQAESFSHT